MLCQKRFFIRCSVIVFKVKMILYSSTCTYCSKWSHLKPTCLKQLSHRRNFSKLSTRKRDVSWLNGLFWSLWKVAITLNLIHERKLAPPIFCGLVSRTFDLCPSLVATIKGAGKCPERTSSYFGVRSYDKRWGRIRMRRIQATPFFPPRKPGPEALVRPWESLARETRCRWPCRKTFLHTVSHHACHVHVINHSHLPLPFLTGVVLYFPAWQIYAHGSTYRMRHYGAAEHARGYCATDFVFFVCVCVFFL